MNPEVIKEVGSVVRQVIAAPIYGVLAFLLIVFIILILLPADKRKSVTENFVLIIRAVFRQPPPKPPDVS